MPSALSVAREFERLAEASRSRMSSFKLQKLLYFAQAWSLVVRDWQLFDEPMEAWVSGPVVRDVYAFTKRAGGPVPLAKDFHPTDELSAEETGLLAAIWEHYSRFTPDELVDMTHADGPWEAARGDLPPGAHSRTALDLNVVTKTYAGRLRPDSVAVYEEMLQTKERYAAARLPAMPLLGRRTAEKGPPPSWYDEHPVWDATENER